MIAGATGARLYGTGTGPESYTLLEFGLPSGCSRAALHIIIKNIFLS